MGKLDAQDAPDGKRCPGLRPWAPGTPDSAGRARDPRARQSHGRPEHPGRASAGGRAPVALGSGQREPLGGWGPQSWPCRWLQQSAAAAPGPREEEGREETRVRSWGEVGHLEGERATHRTRAAGSPPRVHAGQSCPRTAGRHRRGCRGNEGPDRQTERGAGRKQGSWGDGPGARGLSVRAGCGARGAPPGEVRATRARRGGGRRRRAAAPHLS